MWEACPEAGAAAAIRNNLGLTEWLKLRDEKTTIDGVSVFIGPECRESVLISKRIYERPERSEMKVVVCEEPGRLAVLDRPRPTPAAGEVLVQIRRIGVCGTDFHIFGGKHPYLEYPRVIGHELSGTVVATPEGSALEPGQNVYIVPYLSCGRCLACRKGLTNACQNIRVLGVHCDGGMAEYLAVPEQNVVPVGDTSLDDAAMIEFLAIGAHGVKRGSVTSADRVLVVGSGPIGMSAIIFAKAQGGFKRSSQRVVCRLTAATGQAPQRAFAS